MAKNMRKGSVSMKDIAMRLNVHVSTVSLALRDDSRISSARRLLIKRAAEEMGYRKNPLISSLMMSRRSSQPLNRYLTIAYARSLPHANGWMEGDATVDQFYASAVERAAEQGFNMQLFDPMADRICLERFTKILESRGISGLIVGPVKDVFPASNELYSRLTMVSLGRRLPVPGINRVAVDHSQCVRLALKKCADAGYKRVGFCVPEQFYEGAWEDTVGPYLAWSTDGPHQYFENLPVFDFRKGTKDPFKKWLESTRPEVLLTNIPERVLPLLSDYGIHVPDELPVILIGKNDFGSAYAGVQFDYSGVGSLAADLVISSLLRNECGIPAHSVEMLLTGNWVGGPSFPEVNRKLKQTL